VRNSVNAESWIICSSSATLPWVVVDVVEVDAAVANAVGVDPSVAEPAVVDAAVADATGADATVANLAVADVAAADLDVLDPKVATAAALDTAVPDPAYVIEPVAGFACGAVDAAVSVCDAASDAATAGCIGAPACARAPCCNSAANTASRIVRQTDKDNFIRASSVRFPNSFGLSRGLAAKRCGVAGL
jgi:hypothetical protein